MHLMRRATSPAICTNATGTPSAAVTTTPWRSLCSLALSSDALKNLPGLYAVCVTTPSTGMRFTCTSNTFMNTEMRVRGASPMPSSGGGAAGDIACTTPSAGLMISPWRVGVTRDGSRKKYVHQSVRTTQSSPSGVASHHSTAVAAAKPAMNGQPARLIGASTASSDAIVSPKGLIAAIAASIARPLQCGRLLPGEVAQTGTCSRMSGGLG